MAFTLKRAVAVVQDGVMVTLDAGTKLSDVPAEAKAQLAPDHFTDGEGGTPTDWRDDAARDRDAAQAAGLAALRGEG
jgi:hypothetical protein